MSIWLVLGVQLENVQILWEKMHLFRYKKEKHVIQSIVYRKLQHIPIFLAIYGFRPKRTAPAWRPKTNRAIFWFCRLKWSVFRVLHSTWIESGGSQKGPGLGYTAGGVTIPIQHFQRSFWPVECDVVERFHHEKWLIRVWSHILAVFAW